MARKLGEILVAVSLITPEQLQQALEAQSHFGGRLGTNLVELGFVTEKQLAMALSKQLNVPFVSADGVANVPPEVVAAVPREVAREHRIVPLRFDRKGLYVCLSDPTDLRGLDELGFKLNHILRPYVITEVALNYALERYYGVPREIRYQRMSMFESAPVKLVELADGTSGIVSGDRGDVLSASMGDAMPSAATSAPPPAATSTPQGGSIRDVTRELALADSRARVIQLLLEVLGETFPQVCLLGVDAEQLVGAGGSGIDAAAVPGQRLGVASGSLLADVLHTARVVHRDRVDDAPVMALCRAVGMATRLLTIIPVLEHRRPAFVGVCGGVDPATLKRAFPALRRFLAQVSYALQVLTLRQRILEAKES